ncbi:hypothetical protein [Sphingomonas sp.]|uniref:hypothetical protein n=1 Tax=Sphingomonas sp. TaxID=28214 RepID=UPI0028AEC5E6|nr:hypothetical protein [Sphingomonas sp.]
MILGQTQTPQVPQQTYQSRSPTIPGEAMARAQQTTALDPVAIRKMQAFGKCVAQRHPQQAAALLQMDFTSPQYQQGLRKLAISQKGCLGGNVRAQFAGVVFAGALAEQLLASTGDLASALTYDPAKAAVKTFSPSDYIAACVARTAPKDVAGLLAAPVATDTERNAIRQLVPVVQQCTSNGQQARFNQPGLRAILATASYRIVMASKKNAAAG